MKNTAKIKKIRIKLPELDKSKPTAVDVLFNIAPAANDYATSPAEREGLAMNKARVWAPTIKSKARVKSKRFRPGIYKRTSRKVKHKKYNQLQDRSSPIKQLVKENLQLMALLFGPIEIKSAATIPANPIESLDYYTGGELTTKQLRAKFRRERARQRKNAIDIGNQNIDKL